MPPSSVDDLQKLEGYADKASKRLMRKLLVDMPWGSWGEGDAS